MTKDNNISMLNRIDFELYLQRHRDLATVVWDIEEDYSKLPELASTNGNLLPTMTMDELSKYLTQRYPAYEFYYDDWYMCRPRKMEEDDE